MSELDAGPEMDERIARVVMGKENVGFREGEYVLHMDGTNIRRVPVPKYSSDIAAAWQVVERVRGQHAFQMFDRGDMQFSVIFGASAKPDGYAVAVTAPLAVCRAALSAVEVA